MSGVVGEKNEASSVSVSVWPVEGAVVGRVCTATAGSAPS